METHFAPTLRTKVTATITAVVTFLALTAALIMPVPATAQNNPVQKATSSVVMTGTIRTFDEAQRQQIPELVKRTAESIAAASGATAAVEASVAGTITYNDPALVERMRPTVERVVAGGIPGAKVLPGPPTTTSEDFSLYQQKVPGLFMFLGITPEGTDPKLAAPNHSPKFYADERALPIGVKLLSSLALDYLSGPNATP